MERLARRAGRQQGQRRVDFSALHSSGWVSTTGLTFILITLAEFGDKSQLVCMTLAARHRGWPIVAGATSAFAVLNLLAVLFGAAVARWLPESVVAAAVAVLFAGFGIHALRYREDDDGEEMPAKSGHGLFITAFLLIVVAEFGDKTQIAVAGMSSAASAGPVWVGATLALAFTSAVGVLAGRRVLNRLPLVWLHRVSGVLFLGLAAMALSRAL